MHHFFKFAIDGVTSDNPKHLLNDFTGSITRDPFALPVKGDSPTITMAGITTLRPSGCGLATAEATAVRSVLSSGPLAFPEWRGRAAGLRL